jgi:hypothetical protein
MQRLVMAGLIKIQRYEQLWVECNITSIRGTPSRTQRLNATLRRSVVPPAERNSGPRNERNSSDVPWSTSPLLGSHRIKFESVRYKGNFIQNEQTRYSGQYHNVPTTYFRLGSHTIILYTKKIKIWIHDSKGVNLAAQKEDARTKAVARLSEFAEMYRLLLEAHDLNNIAGSEHTFEDSSVDVVLRPIVEEESERMNERLGMAINQTSHPGKIELHERNPEVGSQYTRGQRVEYLIDRFAPIDAPVINNAIQTLLKVSTEISGKVVDLDRRLQALEVMR